MMKKFISFLLCITLLTIPFFSANAYLIGDPSWNLATEYIVESENTIINGNTVTIDNGYVLYDFYMPFDCVAVDIAYQTANDTTITLKRTDTYTVSAPSDETTIHYEFPVYERKGVKTMRFESDGNISIKGVTFWKEDVTVPTGKTLLLPDLTENERAIETSVILDTESNILIVRGGRRYIDYNNTELKLQNIEGTTYLPVHTLARAFGMYYEDMPDKNYVLLRHGTLEYAFKDGVSYKRTNSENPKIISNPFVYIEGEAFAPVRYFAEELGKTVSYRDGIIAIDDNKFAVKEIMENEEVFSFVRGIFEPFRKENIIGNTYYVAQTFNASDENSGSIDEPFRTLKKAGEVAQAGDTVIIREGTYREILSPVNDGLPNAPIVFRAADGEKVVISANEEITDFVTYNDNLLVSSVAWDLGDGRNQIFYNGEALAEGRHPNGNSIIPAVNRGAFGDLFPTTSEIYVGTESAVGKTAYSDTQLDQQDDYWKGGIYVSCHGYAWTLGSAKIEASKSGMLQLGETTSEWWFNPQKDNNVNFGYITNHVNTIDRPGEWTVKNNSLYIMPPAGETKDTLKLEVKRRQIVADLADRSYIQLIDIDTIGGGMRLNNSNMCMINGGEMSYVSHFTHFIDAHHGYIDDNNKYDENGAPERGEVGIFIGGRDNAVVNSKIDYSAGAGILGVGTYAYIENNIISNCGYMGHYVSGITFQAQMNKGIQAPRGGFGIYGNTVYNSGRSVLNIGGNDQWLETEKTLVPFIPFEIAFNHFYNGLIMGRDGGVTYDHGTIQGHEKLNSMYHNNIVYTQIKENRALSAGIYHDGYTQGIDTYDNIIFNTDPNVFYTLKNIYIQTQAGVAANCNAWNNSLLDIRDGIDDLNPSEYPYGKPFKVGSDLDGLEYLVNYNNIGSDFDCYPAVNGEHSVGVNTENGIAEFSGNGQWVKFSNVNFGENNNVLDIHFKGDKYNTGDVIEIIIGDTIEDGQIKTFKLKAEASGIKDNNINRVTLANRGLGTKTIYIRMKDYKSASIDKISTSHYVVDSNLVTQVFGGLFDEIILQSSSGVPTVKFDVPGDQINPLVNNTWPGTILGYYDVEVPEEADTLVMATASGSSYAGQTFTLRLGGWNGEVIATYTDPKSGWGNYVPQTVSLTRTLEPGIYDFYLRAEGGDENAGKTSDVYYFGFKHSEATEKLLELDISSYNDEYKSGLYNKVGKNTSFTVNGTPVTGSFVSEGGETKYLTFATGRDSTRLATITAEDEKFLNHKAVTYEIWAKGFISTEGGVNGRAGSTGRLFSLNNGASTPVTSNELMVHNGSFYYRPGLNSSSGMLERIYAMNAYNEQWTHFVFTRNYNEKTGNWEYQTFANGEKIEAGSSSSAGKELTETGMKLFIGGDGTSLGGFQGSIAGFSMYKGILTDEEIRLNYEAQKAYFTMP